MCHHSSCKDFDINTKYTCHYKQCHYLLFDLFLYKWINLDFIFARSVAIHTSGTICNVTFGNSGVIITFAKVTAFSISFIIFASIIRIDFPAGLTCVSKFGIKFFTSTFGIFFARCIFIAASRTDTIIRRLIPPLVVSFS